MSAGQLRSMVALQSQVTTQDDLGQPSTAWITVASVWADIRYQTGLEAIKSGADVSVVRVSIRMRYRAVNAGQRVLYNGTVLTFWPYSLMYVKPMSIW